MFYDNTTLALFLAVAVIWLIAAALHWPDYRR
jgi:hypothetical protein